MQQRLWGFSRQEHGSGLPCPPPGDLPNPGIEPRSPALEADSLPSEPTGKPKKDHTTYKVYHNDYVALYCLPPQLLNTCFLTSLSQIPPAEPSCLPSSAPIHSSSHSHMPSAPSFLPAMDFPASPITSTLSNTLFSPQRNSQPLSSRLIPPSFSKHSWLWSCHTFQAFL